MGEKCKQHVRHHLLGTEQALYDIYLLKAETATPGGYKLSMHQFRLCKPYYVTMPDRKTCMCIYHQKYNLAMDEYRRLSKEWHKNCKCECDFCKDSTSGCSNHPNRGRQKFKAACLHAGGEDYDCCSGSCRRGAWQASTSSACGFANTKMSRCPCENSAAQCKYKVYDEEEYELPKHKNTDAYGEKSQKRKRVVIKTKTTSRRQFMQHGVSFILLIQKLIHLFF